MVATGQCCGGDLSVVFVCTHACADTDLCPPAKKRRHSLVAKELATSLAPVSQFEGRRSIGAGAGVLATGSDIQDGSLLCSVPLCCPFNGWRCS